MISLNVNHSQNLGGVLNYIVNSQPCVICLQEVGQDTEELSGLVSRFGYLAASSLSMDLRPGVAILYKSTLPVQEVRVLEPGRIQLLQLIGDGFPQILNLYAPTGNNFRDARRTFYGETILRNLRLRGNLPILIGDFNCVTNRIDTTENFNLKKCEALSDLVNLFGYSDGFRTLYPNDIQFTFVRPHMAPSRLDRVYLPPLWKEKVMEVNHFPTLSDHKGLEVTLDAQAPVRQPRVPSPYWKLNACILQEVEFMEKFRMFWEILVEAVDPQASVSSWWEEVAKPEIRIFLQDLSRERSRARKGTKLYLFHRLDKALGEQDWESVSYIRTRLKAMFQEDLQGFLIRSWTKEFAEEERGSLYHVNREVKQGRVSNLSSLMINGVEERDSGRIEEEVLGFYGPLFNGNHRTVEGEPDPVDTGVPFRPSDEFLGEFLEGLGELPEEERDALEQPLSMEELEKALESCASHRSPGLDGLPYEFYQRTRTIIGPTLVQVFQDQLDSGELIKSNREGVTRLISKVTGVPTITQVRPITLLCCDYKILSKIIASRLNKVLPKVLTSNQLCTNSPKSILGGAVNTLSTIDYVNQRGLSAYLVSFDIFKAYDKTSVDFICKVLVKMKFPQCFIGKIKTMHCNINTCFIVGSLTRKLPVSISLRQGDPSAMPLYLINQEPLLVQIGKGVTGVSLAGFRQKDEDYVDDISALSTDTKDLLYLDQTFRKFESMSGTVLNRSNKSKIMGLGNWVGRDVWPLPWLRTEETLKIFGVQFKPTVKATVVASWENCLQGFKKCLLSWSSRMLPTLQQRVFVISTFAMSKLWYLGQILPLPRKTLDELDRLTRKFLWLGRLEHLPYDELHAPVKEGGLGVPNIQAKCDALFLKQTCRMLHGETSCRKHLSYWIGLQLRNYFPDLARGLNAERTPTYFKHSLSLLKEGFSLEILSPGDLGLVKVKSLYWNFLSTPPPPRIISRFPALPWPLIFGRMNSPVLSPASKDLMFIIINNIYPNKKRLNRLNQHPTGNCALCRVQEDNIHLFLDCYHTRPVWHYVRNLIISIKPELRNIPSEHFLRLSFPPTSRENAVIFLVSGFLLYAHERRKEGEIVSLLKYRGYLRHSYRTYNQGKHPYLGIINL